MARGRPRKNLVLLEMSGATKRNPGRYKDRETHLDTNGPIGDPPDSFNNRSDTLALKAKWNKIISEAPVGLLTASDREYVAQLCRWGVEAERLSKNSLRASQLYAQGLKGIGMTPDGRAVRGIGGKASTKETANPLDEFTSRRKRRSA